MTNSSDQRLITRLDKPKLRWGIQVIQHALSLHTYVPLRIWDTSIEPHEKSPAKPGANWKGDISNGDTGQAGLTDELVKYYSMRQNSQWLTVVCNSLPIIEHLRRANKWKAWENQCIAQWLDQIKDGLCTPEDSSALSCLGEIGMGPDVYVKPYFAKVMEIALCQIGPNPSRFLVVGPVLIIPERDASPDGKDTPERDNKFRHLVEKFVDQAVLFLSGESLRIERDEIMLLGGARGWMSHGCLCRKARMLARVIDSIFRVRCDFGDDVVIRNSACNGLARLILLLDQELSLSPVTTDEDLWERCDKSNRMFDLDDVHSIEFEIDHRSDTQLSLLVEKKDESEKWCMTLSKPSSPPQARVKINATFASDEQESRREQRLLWARDDMYLAFSNHMSGYAARKLALLSRWKNDKMGMIIWDPNEEKDKKREIDLLRRLSAKICDLFTADMVTIFGYNPREDLLEPLGEIWFQEKHENWTVRNQWRDIEKEIMKKAKGDQKKRDLSICYRVVERGLSRFCRSWDPEPEKCDPNGETVLNPDDSYFDKIKPYKRMSAMALPLRVHGRLFGVLEIDGFSKHQFRFDNFVFAQQVADIIGPFLHERDTSKRLYGLSGKVLDPTKTETKKYHLICKEMAHIFMADACILFEPNPEEPELFDLKAVFKLEPPQGEDKFARGLNLDLREDPDLSVIIGSSPVPFYRFNVKDMRGKKGWGKGETSWHRQVIMEKFPKGMGIIVPIWDPEAHILLCRLSLYYRNVEDSEVTRKWNPVVGFVAYYLVMLLMTMKSLRPEEEELAHLKRIRKGMDKLAEEKPDVDDVMEILGKLKSSDRGTGDKPADSLDKGQERADQCKKLHEAYTQGRLVMVLGAGVSRPFHVPNWEQLLDQVWAQSFMSPQAPIQKKEKLISEFLSRVFSFFYRNTNPTASARILKNYYEKSGIDFNKAVRDVLYGKGFKDEKPNNFFKEFVRLLHGAEKRPDLIMPYDDARRLDSVITYNFDDIVQDQILKAWSGWGVEDGKVFKTIYSSKQTPDPRTVPIFHVHGYLPRPKTIDSQTSGSGEDSTSDDEKGHITLSDDKYHEQYSATYAWNTLAQLTRFTNCTCLFVGVSFDDPNLRRLMDVAWKEKNEDKHPPRHYIVKRRHDQKKKKRDLVHRLQYMLIEAGLWPDKWKVMSQGRDTLTQRDKLLESAVDDINQVIDDFNTTMLDSFNMEPIWIKGYDEIPGILHYIRTGTPPPKPDEP